LAKKTIAIGILGTQLDAGREERRWEKWRPTVSACQHEDLVIDRFELLYPASHRTLVNNVKADMKTVSPETDVRSHNIEFKDAWDFEEVFGTLYKFVRNDKFDTEKNEYLFTSPRGLTFNRSACICSRNHAIFRARCCKQARCVESCTELIRERIRSSISICLATMLWHRD